VNVEPYQPETAPEWDELVEEDSCNGTFLLSRRFLGYHGARFEDLSVVIREEKIGLVGVLPAAVDPHDASGVVSHPGLTYGGLVHTRRLRGDGVLEALEAIAATYSQRGFRRLVYRVVPTVFHTVPAEDDRYALFRLGARRSRCDLSAAIDLRQRAAVSTRRLRGFARAERLGMRVSRDAGNLAAFWDVLTANLRERHGTAPVHTLVEMTDLMERFPDNIELATGMLGTDVVAGALLFVSGRVVHTQYLASSDRGRTLAALDGVIEHCIDGATEGGRTYFSFGISTETDGSLNTGLHTFKTEFGAGGIVHETYTLDL
jgi:hypothetical protein